jgi:hypothetical protein
MGRIWEVTPDEELPDGLGTIGQWLGYLERVVSVRVRSAELQARKASGASSRLRRSKRLSKLRRL